MKHRISPATVIASVALFFSLTGGGFAAGYMAAHRYVITSLSQISPRVRDKLVLRSHGTVAIRGALAVSGEIRVAGSAKLGSLSIQNGSVSIDNGSVTVRNGSVTTLNGTITSR